MKNLVKRYKWSKTAINVYKIIKMAMKPPAASIVPNIAVPSDNYYVSGVIPESFLTLE